MRVLYDNLSLKLKKYDIMLLNLLSRSELAEVIAHENTPRFV